MATSIADTTRGHMMSQINADAGTTAYLWVWSGAAPAKNVAPTGTNLAKFAMANPLGSVSGGVLTVTAPANTTGLASGTPNYYRVTTGSTDTNGSTVIIQGSAGITVNPPASPAATGGATGGTLAAGTYYYKITATTSQGETTGSTEVNSGALTGTTSSVALSWTAVPGATGYKVYRSTTSGTYGSTSLLTIVNSGSTVSYTDVGNATITGSIPGYNSAGGDLAFASQISSGGTVGITSLSYVDGNA